MTRIAVVVPTIREDCAQKFLAEWADDLAGARVILVEDNPEPTFALGNGLPHEHYSWRDVETDLGRDAWIIPRRTSAVRSYGLWQAQRGGADINWTLDDDCYPQDGLRGRYLAEVESALSADAPSDAWHNTIGSTKLYPRGYPYGIRDVRRAVMLHHGLWSNVPDLDGITQQANPDFRLSPSSLRETIPSGALFPMCVMNLAWRAEITPALYMLLMGQDAKGQRWGFDRFDDIWAGMFVKRIADHLGYAITSGAPGICHSRASDPRRNAELEAPGMKAHEDLWPLVNRMRLKGDTVAECYLEIATALGDEQDFIPGPEGYWQHLSDAMGVWAGLFTRAAGECT